MLEKKEKIISVFKLYNRMPRKPQVGVVSKKQQLELIKILK